MKTTKYKFLILALCTTALLTACKEDRANPLRAKQPIELLNFISQNQTDEIKSCAKYWSTPDNSSKIDLKLCDPVAKALANTMNKHKFTEDEVRQEDIDLPYIWQDYYRVLSFNRYDTIKARKAFAPIQPFNKNYKAK